MNRRSFLQRLAYGTVATAALVSLPASVIKLAPPLVGPARVWARDKLRDCYHVYVRSHHGQPPSRMLVGREFFELFEGEMIASRRFPDQMIPWQVLRFEGVPVCCDVDLPPYHYEAV